MLSYVDFIRQNFRFLSFGFVLVFIGNFGQTFFVSLFGGYWRSEFSLSHTEYGLYYSAATLISGLTLIWFGARLDTSSLKSFTVIVLIGIAIALVSVANATSGAMLFLCFLLLRFFGQGLSGHTAFTTMARQFDLNRGKAISIAAMGMPAGELVLPLLVAFLLLSVSWQTAWWIFFAVVTLVLIPIIFWALGDPRANRHIDHEQESVSDSTVEKHYRRGEVVKTISFWLATLAFLSPAVIITGLFFHQAYWAEVRNWSIAELAMSLSIYGITHALGSLLAGAAVDRYGVGRMLRLYLLPLVFAMFGLLFADFWGWLWFMLIAGFSVGASGPVTGALWPEVYGTRHLGAIRSLVSGLMVVSTSITPVALGLLIDGGVSVFALMTGMLSYAIIALAICQFVYSSTLRENS